MDVIQRYLFEWTLVTSLLATSIKTATPVCYEVQCLNGGTLITYTGTCICQCPAGYGGIFCEYARQESVWPDGPYLLPRTKYGCPEPIQFGWTEGYINLTVNATLHNWWPYGSKDMIGPFGSNSYQLNFCMKNKKNKYQSTRSDSSNNKWPKGKYRVYGADWDCPKGFIKQYFTIKLPKLTRWNSDGALPTFERKEHDDGMNLVFTLCQHDQTNGADSPPGNSHFIFIKFRRLGEACPSYDGFITAVETFLLREENSASSHKHMRFCSYKPEIKDSTLKQLSYFGPDQLMGCMVLTGYDIVINDFYNEDLQRILSNKNKALYDISTKSIAMCYAWTDAEKSRLSDKTTNVTEREVCEEYPDHFWTGDMIEPYPGCETCKCCQMPGCFNDLASNYNGTWSTTVEGFTCQRWDSNVPHAPRQKPVDKAHNHCREIENNSTYPWCYTTDPRVEFQICNIPKCIHKDLDYVQCYNTATHKEYVGRYDKTVTGRTCQRWYLHSPHRHTRIDPTSLPDDTLAQANNYCRDPSNEGYLWCYTTDLRKRWETCGMNSCSGSDLIQSSSSGTGNQNDQANKETMQPTPPKGLHMIEDVFGSPFPWILFDLGRTGKVSSVRVAVQKPYTYRGQHLPGLELFYEGDFPEMYISNDKWGFLNEGADMCQSIIYFVYMYDIGIYQHKFIRPMEGRYFTIYGSKFQDNVNILAYMLRIQSVLLYTCNSGEETKKVCNKDMGLGGIEDFQISASSSRNGHTPSMAMLTDSQGWCADDADNSPYIQIDMLLPTVIEGITISNWGRNLTKNYFSDTLTTSGGMVCKSFLIWHGNNVSELKIYSEQKFEMDVSLPYSVPQKFTLMTPFVSRFVRLQPEKLKPKRRSYNCMKIEIIGCKKYGYPSLTCADDSTTELTQMKSTYTSVDEPITKSAVLSFDNCEAMCTENMSECSTIEYNHKTRICNIYRPGTQNRFPRSLTTTEFMTSISSNICWQDALEIDSVTVNYQSVQYPRSASIDIREPASITSFGYPFHYDSNIVTRWNISFEEGEYIRLLFFLIDLNIKKDQESLLKDILLITESETLVPYVDDNNEAFTNIYIDSWYNGLNPTVDTNISQIYLIFSSCISTFADVKHVGRGFRTIVLKDDIPTCTSSGNSHYCNLLHMNLASHSYSGLGLFNGEYEYWTIKGRVIEFTLHEFNVACFSGSQFEIYTQSSTDDEAVKQIYCNENKPIGDINSTDTLKVQFFFNAGPNLIAVDGFRASYRIIPMENYKLRSELMVIQEPYAYNAVWASVCSEKFNKCYTILNTHNASYLPTKQDGIIPCRLNGGNQVTIHSREENTYVREIVEMMSEQQSPDVGILDLVLGLSRHYRNGKIEEIWEDGSPVTFTAWDLLEPSKDVDNICVYMTLKRPNQPNTWRTHPCIRDKNREMFMCERPLHHEQYYKYGALVKSNSTTTEVNNTMLYHCNSGEWISIVAQCNGIQECVDSSDEQNCDIPEIDPSISDIFCTDDMFRCNNGDCVHISHVCDFISHCADGTDEYCEFPECILTELRCRNQQCVPRLSRCNGTAECKDGSDENECGMSCNQTTSFPCSNGICLPLSNKCDDYKDCSDGSDELSCDQRRFTSCLDWWQAGYRVTGEYSIEYATTTNLQEAQDKKQVRVRCIFDAVYTENQITLQIPDIDISIEDTDRKTILTYNDEFLNIYSEKNKCTLQFQQTCSPSMLQVATVDGISERSFNQCTCVSYTFNFPKTGPNDGRSVKPCTDNYEAMVTNFKFFNIYDTSDTYVVNQDTLEYQTCLSNPLIECIEEINAVEDTFVCEKEHNVIQLSRKCLYDTDQQGCKSLEHLQNCGDSVCPQGYVKCPSSFCLPLQYVCDGSPQCDGGEDENECLCGGSEQEIVVVFYTSDDEEFNSQVRKFAIQFENNNTTVQIVGVSTFDTDIELEMNVTMSAKTLKRSLNDVYSKDKLTNARLYPFTLPMMINSTTATWLSVLNDLFSNATIKQSVIILHNDERVPVINDVLPEHILDISYYNVFVDSSLTSLAERNEFDLSIIVRSWDVIGNVGSVLFPKLCTYPDTALCKNEFRCAGLRTCIPLEHVCDGKLDCYHGDDEAVCNFTCPLECYCHGYNVNCSNIYNNFRFLKLNSLSPFTRYLDMSHNPINNITITPFNMHLLMRLNMSFCELENIPDGVFGKTRNLLILDLQHNTLKVIQKNIFQYLYRLKSLLLAGNTNLYSIEPGAFVGQANIKKLALVGVRIHVLKANTFEGLNLTELDLTSSTFGRIDDFAFKNLIVTAIYLKNSVIKVFSKDMFMDVLSLKKIIAPAYKFCCIRPPSVAEDQCLPYKDEFSSCEDLLRNNILQTLLWVIGISAIVGNSLALVYRLKFDTKRLHIAYGIFVTNLTVADLLMGVYLIMIAIADQTYRNRYIWNDDYWRNSAWCTLAGVLSTLSSETSILFLCLITIDRILVVKFPFGQISFGTERALVFTALMWIIGASIAIIPVLHTDYFTTNFYSKSGVCLALPLTRDRPPGWLYSILIFIGMNMLTFLLITVGQLLIFLEVRKSTRKIKHSTSKRSSDLVVARNLLLVVTTDFMCWVPIGIMGTMSLNGHVISGDVYAWVAVMLLPINSAINPFIYTLPAIFGKQKFNPRLNEQTRTQTIKISTARVDIISTVTLLYQNPETEETQFLTIREALRQRPLKLKATIKLFRQMMYALYILHKYDLIIHQLNDEAILLSFDDTGTIKGQIRLRNIPTTSTRYGVVKAKAQNVHNAGTIMQTVFINTSSF